MNHPDLLGSIPMDWTAKSFVLGSDHAGFETKEFLRTQLLAKGAQVHDMGCYSPESVDYPQVARALASAVVANTKDVQGLLLCGSATACASAPTVSAGPGRRCVGCLN